MKICDTTRTQASLQAAELCLVHGSLDRRTVWRRRRAHLCPSVSGDDGRCGGRRPI